MRITLARWFLALALRMDPDHPITVLRRAVDADKRRGMGGVWHVTVTMPTQAEASRLLSWTMFAMRGEFGI